MNSNKYCIHGLESRMESMIPSGGSTGHLDFTKHHDLTQLQHKEHTQSQKPN